MATYFVASGGSNTSPYDTWAKAATSFQTALTAATTDGDIVVIQYNGVPSADAQLGADTTYTLPAASIYIISSTNSGTSTVTPTVMGTANWIGNSTTNRGIIVSGAADKAVYVYGLTLRTSGSAADSITLGGSAGCELYYDNCYFWSGNSATSARIIPTAASAFTTFDSCTFRFGSTSQGFDATGSGLFKNCTISSDGSAPATLIFLSATTRYEFVGCDLSLITGTLVGNGAAFSPIVFRQCKLGSGVTPLAAQTTNPTKGSAEATILDCSSGDEHYHLWHYSALGQTTISTSVYANDGAVYNAGGTEHSWKIDTTANATFRAPYVTPWFSVHHEGTSAITPYVEALRSGSTTKYKESELWVEFGYKGTASSTKATLNETDKGGNYPASTTDQAASSLGASDWTGEDPTNNAYMKLAPSSSITPAEIGDLFARVYFSVASATVYVDPQIRGRS